KNFEGLTNLFIDYFPLYNKFRAVSSIQVILELCLPILAVFGLYHIFSEKNSFEEKKKALLYSGGILGGLCLIFMLLGKSLFSFAGANDGYYIQAYGMEFINALKDDRKSFLVKDSFRSLLFIAFSAAIVFAFMKQKLSKNIAIGLFAILILADLTVVNKRYVNDENFVNASQVSNPFPKFPADTEIQKDRTHYRVYDLTADAFSSGRASFYHKALGGYHAAKPQRIQDLYDFYLQDGLMEIFNMLNVKYILLDDENQVVASQNDAANGN